MRPIERKQIAENEAGVDAAIETSELTQKEVDDLKAGSVIYVKKIK